jgi:hypothetical protein
MGKYLPVKVNSRQYKQLHKESNGMQIFFRIDKEGQHWAKAALSSGAKLMKSYGLKATL